MPKNACDFSVRFILDVISVEMLFVSNKKDFIIINKACFVDRHVFKENWVHFGALLVNFKEF